MFSKAIENLKNREKLSILGSLNFQMFYAIRHVAASVTFMLHHLYHKLSRIEKIEKNFPFLGSLNFQMFYAIRHVAASVTFMLHHL